MSWTVVSGTSVTAWNAASVSTIPSWPTVGPVSVESRLNPLFPQTERAGIVPFVPHIQTEGKFFVASGSGVFIRSSITEPLY